jgi:hypothetical protein
VRRSLCGFGNVLYSLPASAVDRRKVDDHITRLVNKVTENRVDAGRGIGHEDGSLERSIEELCNGLARLVEQFGIVVSDEDIWSFL